MIFYHIVCLLQNLFKNFFSHIIKFNQKQITWASLPFECTVELLEVLIKTDNCKLTFCHVGFCLMMKYSTLQKSELLAFGKVCAQQDFDETK